MSDSRLYVEGGEDSKELRARCREGFHKLLEKSGFAERLPRIVACGSRNDAFDAFEIAQLSGALDYAALLVDSEDPVADTEKPWEHLKVSDNWVSPTGTTDDRVFIMTTCMETWIIADRESLKRHYRNCLQISSLPAATNHESRHRLEVQEALLRATRNCSNAYAKNKRSFDALANVNPEELRKHCPSFARMIRILEEKL